MEGEANPLRDAFEAALRAVDAVPLTGSDEAVTVGLGEYELRLDWLEIQQALAGTDAAGWADDIAELLLRRIAPGRHDARTWSDLAGAVMPVLFSKTGGAELARRQPEVLAYPYAGVMLITIAAPCPGGWRYLLRSHLADWQLDGEEPITRAIGNLRAVTGPEVLQTLSEEHYVLDCGDGLDSSRLLILDELLPQVAECGALCCVPAREVLSFAPFCAEGIQHLRALVNLAERGYERWPHPLQPSLFYVAPHAALHVPVSHDDDGTPRLCLPQVLADIQAALVQSGKW